MILARSTFFTCNIIFKEYFICYFLGKLNVLKKCHPPSADLRNGEEDSISAINLIFAAIKG